MEKHGVEYFSTNSDKKAAVVERFNKYFYSKGTYNWIDVVDELVDNYNNTKHSTILIKPIRTLTKRMRARYEPHCLDTVLQRAHCRSTR